MDPLLSLSGSLWFLWGSDHTWQRTKSHTRAKNQFLRLIKFRKRWPCWEFIWNLGKVTLRTAITFRFPLILKSFNTSVLIPFCFTHFQKKSSLWGWEMGWRGVYLSSIITCYILLDSYEPRMLPSLLPSKVFVFFFALKLKMKSKSKALQVLSPRCPSGAETCISSITSQKIHSGIDVLFPPYSPHWSGSSDNRRPPGWSPPPAGPKNNTEIRTRGKDCIYLVK